MRRALIALMVIFCTGFSAAQDTTFVVQDTGISLRTFLDKTGVALNRTVTLTIRLEWFGDLDRYQVYKFDNPILQNLEILSTSSSNRIFSRDGKAVSRQDYEYILKPTSLGMGYVEGMIIKYRDLQADRDYRLMTNRLSVTITDPVPEPGSKAWVLYLILGVIAAAILAFSVVWWQRKRQQKRLQIEKEQAEAIPVEQKILDELESIDLNESDPDTGAVLSTISRLLRRYLVQKYGVPGPESTSGEVIAALETAQAEPRVLQHVRDVLTTSDMIRFSGRQADRHEIDRIYTLVEHFIHDEMIKATKQEQTLSDEEDK